MKTNDHVMSTTFVEVITQCSGNQEGSTFLPAVPEKKIDKYLIA